MSFITSQRQHRAIGLAAVAAGVLAFAGCGSDDSASTKTTSASRPIDTAHVESEIDTQLTTPTTAVTSVKCPDDVKAEVGATFECSVTWSNGATGKAEVMQESLTQLTYTAVPGTVKVPGATVEKSIEQELDKQDVPQGQADCPETITVKLDTPITCDLVTPKGHAAGTVTFMFTDESGTVDSSSVESG